MEAVIVATARTPIGRANKGSLVDLRPDDLGATIVQALLEKVPDVDPGQIEDVIWGNAQPAGEAGYNVARVTALLAGLEGVPGVTVNRYCSSSLQTIRMAVHAIKAGEGGVFVAGGGGGGGPLPARLCPRGAPPPHPESGASPEPAGAP